MSKNYKGLYMHIINALDGIMSKDYFIAEVLPIVEDAFIKADKYDEALKRIDELEAENKVLKDGIKALENYTDYDISDYNSFDEGDMPSIYAMFEVVDNEEV